jgi:hypothetical protein
MMDAVREARFGRRPTARNDAAEVVIGGDFEAHREILRRHATSWLIGQRREARPQHHGPVGGKTRRDTEAKGIVRQ